ncbi:hypothetical protein DOTSEDRAFT_26193 [Dothistroma septosporum NZE10]|uniref:GTP cyclohydrolase 1 n=1 Tax=Dothistroma septosporum (strain NZE10 / CBS 128990) TaxID=675120 RepID=N1PM56_DOTSN|nr:hypothetical protein DOTSEDRAFT_26193 [Dothistroma septosporum NZE10]
MQTGSYPVPKTIETAEQGQTNGVSGQHGDPIGGAMQQSAHADAAQRTTAIANAVKTILTNIDEDATREGLLKTPERFAKSMQFFTSGYGLNPGMVANDAIFNVDCNDMVVVQGIDVSSLCEHHLVPFVGKIHIGYIPKGQVLGLPKFARIVEIYARRLQVQERLTRQVADPVEQILRPEGVVVVAECSHLCMSMRGVQQSGTTITTRSRTGAFLTDGQAYEEFCSLIRR